MNTTKCQKNGTKTKQQDYMTNEEKVQYWIDLSDEDLKAAIVLLRGRRYLYVGFMCHQVIEKIFKSYYAKLTGETPPFTHDLSLLAKKGGFDDLLAEEQKDIIDAINPLNIEARYPEYKGAIAKTLTRSKSFELLEQTKMIQQWTKEKILLI
jgi:HEPN domain-containing protein